MKTFHAGTGIVALTALSILGCASHERPDPMVGYERALANTAPLARSIDEAALERVVEFFSSLTVEKVRGQVRDVYAAEAFLQDPLKEVHGVDEIEAYLLEGAEAVERCSFEFGDAVGVDGEYYLRWVMTLQTKRWPDQVDRVPGMTHLRFDEAGKVVFHRDYFDTSTMLFEKVPVIGWGIRKIKAAI